jgi:type II secretory pathway pseudopilin PulG
VTLVELLVTITILAILGSAVVFASFGANRAARIAATQAKVASLHSLVTEKYDEYRVRRFDDFVVPSTAGVNLAVDEKWAFQSDVRLKAMRVLMRMEMPDRWSDVLFTTVEEALPGQLDINNLPNKHQWVRIRLSNPKWQVPVDVKRSVLSQAYLRRYANLKPNATAESIVANEGAECLYMIVTMATADGEALGMFRQSDIGDVDGDGAPEFLDAWGQPIQFLHAAPGFTAQSDLQSADPLADHDPFDHYRVDQDAFRLVPLIYSAGSDGDPDIFTGKSGRRNDGIHPLAARQDLVYYVEPYSTLGTPLDDQVDGELNEDDDDGDNWVDNIHNHDQSARL